MVSLVPVDSARYLGADIVIAVDVTDTAINNTNGVSTLDKKLNLNGLSSFWGFLESNVVASPSANRASSIQRERDRADVLITPAVSHISSLDTSQRRALIAAGSQATTAQMAAIKQLIKEKSSGKYATL